MACSSAASRSSSGPPSSPSSSPSMRRRFISASDRSSVAASIHCRYSAPPLRMATSSSSGQGEKARRCTTERMLSTSECRVFTSTRASVSRSTRGGERAEGNSGGALPPAAGRASCTDVICGTSETEAASLLWTSSSDSVMPTVMSGTDSTGRGGEGQRRGRRVRGALWLRAALLQ